MTPNLTWPILQFTHKISFSWVSKATIEARDKQYHLFPMLQMQSWEGEMNSRLTSGYCNLATVGVFGTCGVWIYHTGQPKYVWSQFYVWKTHMHKQLWLSFIFVNLFSSSICFSGFDQTCFMLGHGLLLLKKIKTITTSVFRVSLPCKLGSIPERLRKLMMSLRSSNILICCNLRKGQGWTSLFHCSLWTRAEITCFIVFNVVTCD